MSKKKSFSIGKSLQQALGDTVTAAKNYSGDLHVEIVPIRKIELDPDNPRDMKLTLEDVRHAVAREDEYYVDKINELESLKTMSKSINEQGIINPIFVYKRGENYRLITGERRTFGSILAGKEDIQAKVIDSKPDALKLSLLQWIENIEREDLTLWERFRNITKIMEAYASSHTKLLENITATELTTLIGCSLQQAVNYKNVIDGPMQLHELIKKNQIRNLEKAAFIAKAPVSMQESLIKACLEGATLKKLKLIVVQFKTLQRHQIKTMGSGRQTKRVHFGSTNNPMVGKIIVEAVLNNDHLKYLKNQLSPIEWQDHKAVSDLFKKLVNIIEDSQKL